MTEIALNYEAQAALEERMLAKGVARYEGNAEFARTMGDLSKAEERVFETALPKMVEALRAAHLDAQAKGGRGTPVPHAKAMEILDHTLLAGITLKNAFNTATGEETMTSLYETVGFEARVAIAAERLKNTDAKAHKKLMNPKLSRSQRARLEAAEALLDQFPEPGVDPTVSVAMGAGLFFLAQQSTDLFEHVEVTDAESGEIQMHLGFTEAAHEALQKVKERQQWTAPVYQAMLTMPNPWVAFDTGAYNDVRVAKTVKMANTFNPMTKKLIAAAIEGNAPFVGALNGIQEVPLRINRTVLEALTFCHDMRIPVGKLPGARKAIPKDADDKVKWGIRKDNKIANAKHAVVSRDLEEAKLLADADRFFQPHVLDWRSRVYAKPGFNHQRADYCKGLFEFADGEVLNETGVKWLKWNVATTYAQKVNGRALDKSPFNVRVQWTEDNIELIQAVAKDPINSMSVWKTADSPFCFLAACVALANHMEAPDTYVCRLPIAIDGSCSGIQHFSAIMRDANGGALVNLMPSELPQDVYAAVAAISGPLVEADLNHEDEKIRGFAQLWSSYGIDRKVTKRNVMTYGYGSEVSGFADQIYEDIMAIDDESRAHFGVTKDNWLEMMEVARYLANHNMTGIKQTVKGAPLVMELLKSIAGILAKANLPVRWTTPMGFPVLNAYYKPTFTRIETLLWNKALNVSAVYRPKVQSGFSKELNAHKQRSSVSPNFIHSFDAAHLQLVVENSKNDGIHSFLLIHDSFAALPNQMDKFSMIVRKSLVEMYEDRDPLEDILNTARADLIVTGEATQDEEGAKKITKLIKELDKLMVPPRGTLDLNSILESQYAFA
jgi:DNA-directed RNA polymerase